MSRRGFLGDFTARKTGKIDALPIKAKTQSIDRTHARAAIINEISEVGKEYFNYSAESAARIDYTRHGHGMN